MSVEVTESCENDPPAVNLCKRIWRLRKLLVIEPLLVLAIIPLGLLSVTSLNFNLEKACLVNFGYDPYICKNVLDKSLNRIDCTGVTIERDNQTYEASNKNSTADLSYVVCKAEMESQKAVTFINGIREPIASIFPIFVILFAGGWSDRNELRKPCMLFPIIGEIISMSAHIISALAMNTIPMEVCALIEKVVPSMFGGQTLLTIGILSYLTETTKEEDRAFRFGIFTVCLTLVMLIGVSLSGILFNVLGYINMYAICSFSLLTAVAYLLFLVPEIKSKNKLVNEAYPYTVSDDPYDMPTEATRNYYALEPKPKSKNICVDFFNPTSAYECFKVFLVKRENNGRMFLILFVILAVLIAAPSHKDYVYLFTMKNLQWDGNLYSAYLTSNLILHLIGTVVVTSLLIRVLKISEAFIGFCSAVLYVISNLFTAYSTTTVMFYVAQSINLFMNCLDIVLNSIISSLIAKEEIGRVYSVLGIAKALTGLLIPLAYSYIYSKTIEIAPGAVFLLSEVFIVPAAILYGIIYILLRRQKKIIKKSKKDTEAAEISGRTITAAEIDPAAEITRF